MALRVNKVEISVHNVEDVDNFSDLLKSKGLSVEALDEGFKIVGNKAMVQYNFETFLNRAKYYSDMECPDVVQFSEKCWGAACFAIKFYFLKNFGIYIQSHSARTIFVHLLADASTRGGRLIWLYKEAEKLHENFYEGDFIKKENRMALMENMRALNNLIWNCDPEIVNEDVQNYPVVLESPPLRCEKTIEGETFTIKFFARLVN